MAETLAPARVDSAHPGLRGRPGRTCSVTAATTRPPPVRTSPCAPWHNPRMCSSRSVTLGLSVALVLGACAGPRSEVIATASPTANFQAFKTYAFVPADRLDMTGSQMKDPVTRKNLEAAIGRELQAKGLSPAGATASRACSSPTSRTSTRGRPRTGRSPGRRETPTGSARDS